MYFYKIGYGTYEESNYMYFSSPFSITEEHLKEKVFSAVKDMIAAEGKPDGMHYAAEIFDDKLTKYLERYNLSVVKPEKTLSFWGWNNEDKLWERESHSIDIELHKTIFGEKGYKRALDEPEWKWKEECERESKEIL